MTYKQTLRFLYSRLPMFQRIGKAAYKDDLGNILSLCAALGKPHEKFISIHIGGTNGKGSTSHMLASVLQECGFKTGLFTSPHLKDFRERVRINGKKIPQRKVVSFVEENKQLFLDIRPSFFEMTTALAFDHFSKEKVDIAVIEVGMGGRLDSTNIISPLVSVITNIGLDHTQYLGRTIKKIAEEKAGIIKKRIPVVIGETQKETKDIFLSMAKQKKSKICFADRVSPNTHHRNGLHGIYQLKNQKTVLATIDVLRKSGFKISGENVRKGLLNVVKNTGLQGRWQVLSRTPLTICDVGHNKDGIKEVLNQISTTRYKRLHFVFGMVSDKDHDEILSMMPAHARYYFCKPDIPRGLDQNELKQKASHFNLEGSCFPSVKAAFRAAKKEAQRGDLIFIGGSTFVVAEVL